MYKPIVFIITFQLFPYLIFSQQTGLLKGEIRDAQTGQWLFAVLVQAGDQAVRTYEEGSFELELAEGSYDVSFSRYGLKPLTVPGVTIVPGDTTVLDTNLWATETPPAFARAEYDYGVCEITWLSAGPGMAEWAYEYGDCDDFFLWAYPGGQTAVRFSEDDHQHVVGGRMYVGDSSYPGPFLGSLYLARVHDDAGMAGLPGNILDEDTVIVDQYGWFGFDKLDAYSESNSYYLSMVQIEEPQQSAPVGAAGYPSGNHEHSYIRPEGFNWGPFVLGNAMIRSWVSRPHDSLQRLNDRLLRYSNFDPNGSPFNGTVVELATTTGGYYIDNAFAGLSAGCYAYGVKSLYNSGWYSPVRLSNIVCKFPEVSVTLNVSRSDNQPEGLIRATLSPLEKFRPDYTTFATIYGPATLNDVFTGKYKLEVCSPGYENYRIDTLVISADTILNILIQEKAAAIENISVHPFTGLLRWEKPGLEQYAWQCDTPSTCFGMTTDDVDLTLAESWILSARYFFTSGYYQAVVDYSTDEGNTWLTLHQLDPGDDWQDVSVDLTDLSGTSGEPRVRFRFYVLFGQQIFLNVDEVTVRATNRQVHPDSCLIFLNDQQIASTLADSLQLTGLINGQTYQAAVLPYYSTGTADTAYMEFTFHELFPPENLNGALSDDSLHLRWSPPAGNWDSGRPDRYPDALAGYLLHIDSDYLPMEFRLENPFDTVLSLPRSPCDSLLVSVNAIYDLAGYGYPGDYLSRPTGPLTFNLFDPLENNLSEDWSTMDFVTHCWKPEGEGMTLVEDQGYPGAVFRFSHSGVEYDDELVSHLIHLSQSMDWSRTLEFDLKLTAGRQSGDELLYVMVVPDSSTSWVPVWGISNLYGSFGWQHFSMGLDPYFSTGQFRIGFRFSGAATENVEWLIDNIHVSPRCMAPAGAEAFLESPGKIRIIWSEENVTGRQAPELYRVYRSINDSAFLFHAETAERFFVDQVGGSGKFCYAVSSVYRESEAECESGHSDTSCVTLFEGIQKNDYQLVAWIYPNPAKEDVVIKSEIELTEICIHNSLGIIVFREENPFHFTKVDLASLPRGTYIIKLKSDVFNQVYKLILN